VGAAGMVGLFLMGAPLSVRAMDGTWSSTSEGDYTNSANWASSQMPDATGTATFNANASYQVDWSASLTNGAANFAAPGGQVTLNIGSGTAWTLANAFSVGTNAGSLAKALVSSGTLSVTNPAGNAATTIGSTSGTGVLAQTGGRINLNFLTNGIGGTITNSGGVMTISSNMTHLGSLYVMNGGVFSNTGPQITTMYGSTTVVSGVGSTLHLANGLYNNTASKPGNYFLISNGGQLVCPTALSLATKNPSGLDTMLITDPGTLVTMGVTGAGGSFWIGTVYPATVIVTNKAGLIAGPGGAFNTIVVGYNGGPGTLVVTDTGSYVRVTGSQDVTIGNAASGNRIVIQNGATWTNTQANLTFSPVNGSNNKILITDPGSIFYSLGGSTVASGNNVITNDSITVSNSAMATFATDITIGVGTVHYANYVEVLDGASFAVRNFYLGGATQQSSNNWLRVSNATFTASGKLDVHGGSFVVQQNGSAKITGLMTLTNGSQSVMTVSGGAVTNGGMVVGSGALVSVSGTGHLQVNGNFTNSVGASTVQFVGTPSAVGRIDVTGTWTNSATAQLTVDLSKYTWPSGSSVTLATFGSMPVQYAAGNITVSNKSVIVKQTASAIIAIKSSGTAVFFK